MINAIKNLIGKIKSLFSEGQEVITQIESIKTKITEETTEVEETPKPKEKRKTTSKPKTKSKKNERKS